MRLHGEDQTHGICSVPVLPSRWVSVTSEFICKLLSQTIKTASSGGDHLKPGFASTNMRTLREIAIEICVDWQPPYFAAVPYLQAMLSLSNADDNYGADDGRTVVNYFLANAKTWRGETARRIKAELKSML